MLEPELEGKNESHKSESKKNSAIKRLQDYASKTLCYLRSSKDKQSLILNINTRDNKNINVRRLTKYLGELSIHCIELNLFIGQYILKKIIYTGLEWYIYTNMQVNHLCLYMHSVQKQLFFFFLHCPSFSLNTVKKMSGFFSILKVNLRGIKCSLYQYIDYLMHLFTFDYISKNISSYLFRCSDIVIEKLVKKIKQKLYHKNKHGFWRANAHICSHQLIFKIKEMLYSWCSYYSSILSRSKIVKINKIIDYIFYKWQIKQN